MIKRFFKLNPQIIFVLVVFGSCTGGFSPGYYESKVDAEIWDEAINSDLIDIDDFAQVQSSLSTKQLQELETIAFDTTLHLISNLGTCEVSGVFVIEDMEIYATCGTAQIWICNDDTKRAIMLTDEGNDRLFKLVRELNGQDPK